MGQREVTVSNDAGGLRSTWSVGPHQGLADEQVEHGGADGGPEPHDFVLMGLGACTAMTLRMYADRKGWPLERVDVKLGLEKFVDGGTKSTRITRTVVVVGPLDDEQRGRLLEIANKCPVHQTLSGPIRIDSALG